MSDIVKISTCLVSVYNKQGLDKIVKKLNDYNVKIISTGGTKDYIEKLNIKVQPVESLTTFPSILGGRVKTLHPKVFGGILARRNNNNDNNELIEYEIPEIDMVIVDLYPFEETLKNTNVEEEIIEKIDIGGISLIRAAAKNFNDVFVISDRSQYDDLLIILEKGPETDKKTRKLFASKAFAVSSRYDTLIYNYFSEENDNLRIAIDDKTILRYGENPHQKAVFWGDIFHCFDQLHGKQLSYNNFLDIEAAIRLISEFDDTVFAIIKHNNPCGIACDNILVEAWKKALAGDPVSAFGGILASNRRIDLSTAEEINKIFFEVIIAPDFDLDALQILKQKKNRIILKLKNNDLPGSNLRSLLSGYLWQEQDSLNISKDSLQTVTNKKPNEREMEDLLFANKVVKHCKSNAIALVKNKMLVANGIGQTSRVDALRQAIAKANGFGFDLNSAVMASDAFFPFADSVEIAHAAGISAVIQPGGSVRDKDSINYCNENNIAMVFTGIRHFKH
ncbi:MAG: bifunctional phosphoribosylaminoimidazolecarboxamide formyltransferase/IMP cyclohydrolase [Marinilabiliales bacterium]